MSQKIQISHKDEGKGGKNEVCKTKIFPSFYYVRFECSDMEHRYAYYYFAYYMFLKIALEPAVVVHAYDPTISEVEVKRTRIQGQSFGNKVNLKSVWST